MNKTELVVAVAAKTGLSAAKASEAIGAIFDTIAAEIATGEKVTIHGFGAFLMKDRAARTARNPSTGETIHVPAKKVAKFTPGSGLKG